MRQSISTFVLLMCLCFSAFQVKSQVPPRPNPPRLVNDYAGILGDTQLMEDSLENIALHTSNQICVVTMSDLGGLTSAMMAHAIGNEWGIGTAENNNGIVILIKPLTPESKGQVYIALGDGFENVISDSLCTVIVNEYMIPHFKVNDYVGGAWAGINMIHKLAVHIYNEEDRIDLPQNQQSSAIRLLPIILCVFVLGSGLYTIYMIQKHHYKQQSVSDVDDTGE